MEDRAEPRQGFLKTKVLLPFQADDVITAYTRDGYMLSWDTGCLSGDTEVEVKVDGCTWFAQLQDVVSRMHDLGGTEDWSRRKVFIACDLEGRKRFAQVIQAHSNGLVQTYLLTTAAGRSIRGTADHPFLTPDGWVRLGVLAPGDIVCVHSGGKDAVREGRGRYDRVLSVDPYEVEQVYDLTVAEDHHSYLANDFVVHNCGKSIGAMALAQLCVGEGEIGQVLLVCERNKLREWKVDFETDTDLTVRIHHGPGRWKAMDKHGMPQVLITTYETAKRDCVDLSSARKLVPSALTETLAESKVLVVYDECARLRNRSSANYKAHDLILKTLRKGGGVKILGLTGTPIEKGYEDGFNQLRLLVPGMPLIKEFESRFVNYRDIYGRPTYKWENIPEFLDLVRPHIGRKRKTDPDVIEQFPPLTENYRYVELSPPQKAFYRTIESLVLEEADDGSMASWALLRQIAGHPASILHSHAHAKPGSLLDRIVTAVGAEHIQGLGSAKTDELVSYLSPIMDQEAKALVFTFFAHSILPELESRLSSEGFMVFTYHGGKTAAENERAKTTFKNYQGGAILLASDAAARGINLPEATYVCVEASTPVLTDDLRWIPAGSLKVGDGILGCEEDRRPGKGREKSRHWQLGSVVRNQVEPRRCLKLTLSNGDSLTVTPEHRMIVQNGKRERDWVRADKIRIGWKILKYLDTWEPARSFDDGWLSGIFDGEGWFCSNGRGSALAVAQNPGFVLDRLRPLVLEAGFTVREDAYEAHGPIRRFHITGGLAEQTRFLGIYRPVRLIPKWRDLIERRITSAIEAPEVVSVEDAGTQDVAILETSIRTFVGAGYMHHNCEFESALTHASRIQRRDRTHRLGSKYGPVTALTLIAEGTIEEQIMQSVLARNTASDRFLGDADGEAGEEFVSAGDRRALIALAREAHLMRKK